MVIANVHAAELANLDGQSLPLLLLLCLWEGLQTDPALLILSGYCDMPIGTCGIFGFLLAREPVGRTIQEALEYALPVRWVDGTGPAVSHKMPRIIKC